MEKPLETLENNSFELKGKMLDVCKILEDDAKQYKGITVGAYIRLRKIQRAIETQIGENIWSQYEQETMESDL